MATTRIKATNNRGRLLLILEPLTAQVAIVAAVTLSVGCGNAGQNGTGDGDGDGDGDSDGGAPDAALPPPTGELLWALGVGGIEGDAATDAALLPDDSVLVTGVFHDVVIFGAGEPNETTLTSTGPGHTFIARLDSGGALIWVRRVAESAESILSGPVAALDDGTLVVGGRVFSDATFGMGEVTETVLPCTVGCSFVARFDTAGNFISVTTVGSPGSTPDLGFILDLEAAPGGTAVIVGSTGVARYDRDNKLSEPISIPASTVTVLDDGAFIAVGSIGTPQDGFVARYNADDTQAWFITTGLPFDFDDIVSLRAVGATPDGSSIVVGGFRISSVANGALLQRYTGDGELVWSKEIRTGGSAIDDVAVASDGAALVTGNFSSPITFDPDRPTEVTLTNDGTDSFLARYAPDSALVWVQQLGGPGLATADHVALSPDDEATIVGRFASSITVGSGASETLTSAGARDALIARFAR